MKHMLPVINGIILILCITTAGVFAHQTKPIASIQVKNDDEAGFVDMAHFTLGSAVQTALQAVPGKALKAELRNEDGSLVYEIEVIKPDHMVTAVEVDAGNKKVLRIAADRKN